MTNNNPHIVTGWTEQKYWQFIRSGLRSICNRYPPKYEVLNESRRAVVKPPPKPGEKKSRQKWEYQCNQCKGWFKSKEVIVDHIIPCGVLTCFEHLVEFCRRLFCGKKGLQVLCKEPCHAIKTYSENHNVSLEQAAKRLEVIKFLKLPLADQKTYLKENGFKECDIKNKKTRESAFVKLKGY